LYYTQARNQGGAGKKPPQENVSPPSPEKCVGQSLKILHLVQKILDPLGKLFAPEMRRIRDDHGAGVPEWTPARVCILDWRRSWSQYFRFEPGPESILRSVQEPIKNFKGPNLCNDACFCQTEWD